MKGKSALISGSSVGKDGKPTQILPYCVEEIKKTLKNGHGK